MAAVVQRVLRGSAEERPEDRARIVQLLLSHPWKVATTMPRYPHSYTLRRQWSSDADFVWCVEYIRLVGYEQFYIGRTWTYYDIAEHQYWDCGGPMKDMAGINRAVRRTLGRNVPGA